MADAEDVRIVSFRPMTVARTSTPFLWVRRSVRRLRWPAFIRSALPAIFWDHCAATAATSCAAQFAGWRMKAVVSCYLAQEGRGIGLTNKLRAYMLQDSGLDTVEANHHLGFGSDERDFSAAEMLRQLGIESVRLLTNNPAKIAQLERYGIEVAGRVAHVFGANVHNRRYLLTKAERSGHMLALDELQSPAGNGSARLPVI